MSTVERWTPTGIAEVDRAVATWRPASMLPAQFKDKQGQPKLEDLALAAHWLYVLDVPPIPNLPDVYVIKGRVGLMAQLQIALAARDGYDLEVVTSTAERATVRIRHGRDPGRPPVTVTWAEAERAGWTRRSPNSPDQPSNYELMPDRMLLARAITKALGLYAPGVRRGIAAQAAPVAELADDEEDLGPGPGGETGPGPNHPGATDAESHPPPPPVAPDDRQWLIHRLEWTAAHEPELHEWLRAAWKATGRPPLADEGFSVDDARLLRTLLNVPRADLVDEPTPPDVHDNLPEAVDADWQPASYADPDDPGRPFGDAQ